MLKHAATVAKLNHDRATAYLLRDYFSLRRGVALMPALLERGLGQADLVLALLRLRDRHTMSRTPGPSPLCTYIESLVGHPMTIDHTCLSGLHRPPPPRHPPCTPDERRIVRKVAYNPRQPNTHGHALWSHFQVGRTVAQLRARGVPARELRRAVQMCWIVLDDVVEVLPL